MLIFLNICFYYIIIYLCVHVHTEAGRSYLSQFKLHDRKRQRLRAMYHQEGPV